MIWHADKRDSWKSGVYRICWCVHGYTVWAYGRNSRKLGDTQTLGAAQAMAQAHETAGDWLA